MVRRMLRISEENDRVIREFHEACGPGAKEGGFGRVFRSPTLFEDMVKCILLCNCTWPRTLSMARALCELQLEMQSHSTSEVFHPQTPQPRELKRKRARGKKTVLTLEAKFTNNEAKSSEEANLVIKNDHQPEHPQGNEACESILSDTGDFSNIIGDFPTPEELANLDPQFLAKRCGVGYRARRIISLAKSIVDGTLRLRDLEQVCDGCVSSSYEELDKQLAGINGFGPFTRANVLMCMGFYEKIPADTETLRHLRMVHGRSCTMKSVQKDLEAVYGKYGRFQFLAYWSELWDYYETRFGNFSEMSACDYPLFTAANMRKKVSKRKHMN
ncbi:uncharacterized protein A4U43_C05F550 [Asparagus officinalis]|uniref:DNA-(apurinic or apyrimidinic site) lyase n=1 Tax=Asparagus officinalis TaxID=4686 RepID=A0A5P1ENH6_ASPOF|nr:uncharacterized protein LOC109843927 [Asparagus officinalis]ONK67486.1 uncharacterized protein A4U43_C05F550 [Asparagus officinalis]